MSQNKQLPRDVLVIQGLLKEMGVTSHEPRVINQMLEFIYRYVTSVVEEARVYSSYAKKKVVDVDDVKLAIKMLSDKCYSTVPPREMLLDVAKQKNNTPLPLLKSCSGLRLPPDRFCLTQPNYQLQFYKRAIASSASQPSNTNVRVQGSPSVFKTPSNLPPKSASSANAGSSGQPTFRVLSAAEASPSTSTQPVIQYTPSGTPIGTPTIRVLSQSQQQSVISTGVKRKLSEDPEDAFGSF
ncbi:unnamed protein product [Allacma fusca]|uniref:Transcription initiation factor TFIID subunit 9 n=1 Tax=Allacma fusca TaxID=39272 RepID=A0A8J2MGJ5_9HEXA|nr:unnamed protein product [Allacma fusca]